MKAYFPTCCHGNALLKVRYVNLSNVISQLKLPLICCCVFKEIWNLGQKYISSRVKLFSGYQSTFYKLIWPDRYKQQRRGAYIERCGKSLCSPSALFALFILSLLPSNLTNILMRPVLSLSACLLRLGFTLWNCPANYDSSFLDFFTHHCL